MQGVIEVARLVEEAQRREASLKEWQSRMKRQEERREESWVLREWWQTPEKDRDAVVSQYREVFDRIHRNRVRAARIAAEERAILDRAMKAKGYVIREGMIPRYVRPR